MPVASPSPLFRFKKTTVRGGSFPAVQEVTGPSLEALVERFTAPLEGWLEPIVTLSPDSSSARVSFVGLSGALHEITFEAL